MVLSQKSPVNHLTPTWLYGLSEPIFGPDDDLAEFKHNFALVGIAATTSAHAGRFMVAAEPIGSGNLGKAYLSGICPVLLEIVDTTHIYADIIGDAMKTGSSGAAQILWKQSGTGTGKWALIRFSGGGSGTHVTPLDLTVTPNTATHRETTWNITDQGENDGVKVYRERTFWETPSLKGSYWHETYDSLGNLVAATAETEFIIVTFTNFTCPT